MGGGGGGVQTHPPSEKSQKCNTNPNPLKNYEATKPAFNVGPSSACQGNTIKMAFCRRPDDGPLLVLFGSSCPLSNHQKQKKNIARVGPPLAKLSGSSHV